MKRPLAAESNCRAYPLLSRRANFTPRLRESYDAVAVNKGPLLVPPSHQALSVSRLSSVFSSSPSQRARGPWGIRSGTPFDDIPFSPRLSILSLSLFTKTPTDFSISEMSTYHGTPSKNHGTPKRGVKRSTAPAASESLAHVRRAAPTLIAVRRCVHRLRRGGRRRRRGVLVPPEEGPTLQDRRRRQMGPIPTDRRSVLERMDPGSEYV